MKSLLLIASIIVIILLWAWLDGLWALLISFAILGIWAIFEGDSQKQENTNRR